MLSSGMLGESIEIWTICFSVILAKGFQSHRFTPYLVNSPRTRMVRFRNRHRPNDCISLSLSSEIRHPWVCWILCCSETQNGCLRKRCDISNHLFPRYDSRIVNHSTVILSWTVILYPLFLSYPSTDTRRNMWINRLFCSSINIRGSCWELIPYLQVIGRALSKSSIVLREENNKIVTIVLVQIYHVLSL